MTCNDVNVDISKMRDGRVSVGITENRMYPMSSGTVNLENPTPSIFSSTLSIRFVRTSHPFSLSAARCRSKIISVR
jgi:hypothetical protein